MATINVGDETKERFRSSKLKFSAKEDRTISEDEFIIILLEKLEGIKK